MKYVTGIIILSVGLGVGFAFGMGAMLADHPSIVVETRWKTVTTAPPPTYEPETPFHMDPNVCADYVPPTTTTTAPKPVVTAPPTTVPPTLPPSTTTTTATLPPSTLPPSSTTLTTG